jgi:dipeptidyl aminopeptidase/acylaminoacyl peptidase
VNADGSGSHIAFEGANQAVNPAWSPDRSTIAFERNDGPHWVIWLVDPSGANPRPVTSADDNSRFPQWSPAGNRFAFTSDHLHLRGGATQYQYALYLAGSPGGKPTKIVDDVHPLSPERWSPTGAQLAVAAGEECKRWGIYVVSSAVPARPRRRTNLCRFDGGPGPDKLVGTPYSDIIRGFAGRDRIYAGDGDDRIEARDGFRDLIDCGPGNDTAVVDRLDVVRNCEHV